MMFALDGNRTGISIAAQMILEHSELRTDSDALDSFALTLYRIDPVDRYPYIIAYAGIRQPEPMFGPYNENDFRSAKDLNKYTHHPLGFQNRESTVSVNVIQRDHWQLFVNS